MRLATKEVWAAPHQVGRRVVGDHDVEILDPKQSPFPAIYVCRIQRVAVEGEQNAEETNQQIAEG